MGRGRQSWPPCSLFLKVISLHLSASFMRTARATLLIRNWGREALRLNSSLYGKPLSTPRSTAKQRGRWRAKRRNSERWPFFCFCVPHHYCLLWTHVRVFVHAFSTDLFFGFRSPKRAYEQSYARLYHLGPPFAGRRPSFRLPQLQPTRFDSTTCISTPTHLFWPAIDCRHRFFTTATHTFRPTTPEIYMSLPEYRKVLGNILVNMAVGMSLGSTDSLENVGWSSAVVVETAGVAVPVISQYSWGFVLARFRGKRYPREW